MSKRWYAAAVGLFGLAILSKTVVAPLPLVLLGIAGWKRGRLNRQDVLRTTPFFVIAGAMSLVAIWFQYHRVIGSAPVRSGPFWLPMISSGWALWFYLYKALWPVHLIFVYPRWRIDPSNLWAYVPTLSLPGGLLLCWANRSRWGRPCLFGLGYFVVMLLPVLGFFKISFLRFSFVSDHWQYFALPGPVVLAAAGVNAGIDRLKIRRAWLKPAIGSAVLLVLGALTSHQSRIYGNLEALWQATLVGNPNCPMAHNDLGNALLHEGRAREAIAHFQKALNAVPDYELAHYNLGCALLESGTLDEAIDHFRQAAIIDPGFVEAHYNWGAALLQDGRIEAAIPHFQKAARSSRSSTGPHQSRERTASTGPRAGCHPGVSRRVENSTRRRRNPVESGARAGESSAGCHAPQWRYRPGESTGSVSVKPWWKRDWFFALMLAGATLLAYQPAWHGAPVFDDEEHLTPPELRSWTGLARIWIRLGATVQYYPVTHTVFWAENKLWGDWMPGLSRSQHSAPHPVCAHGAEDSPAAGNPRRVAGRLPLRAPPGAGGIGRLYLGTQEHIIRSVLSWLGPVLPGI